MFAHITSLKTSTRLNLILSSKASQFEMPLSVHLWLLRQWLATRVLDSLREGEERRGEGLPLPDILSMARAPTDRKARKTKRMKIWRNCRRSSKRSNKKLKASRL